MKEIKLTMMQRDALLFKALIRGVFPTPKKGQMYFPPQLEGAEDAKFLYLNSEYYETLFNAIKAAEREGKFSSSNAEFHWLGLISGFKQAKEVQTIDYERLSEWSFEK